MRASAEAAPLSQVAATPPQSTTVSLAAADAGDRGNATTTSLKLQEGQAAASGGPRPSQEVPEMAPGGGAAPVAQTTSPDWMRRLQEAEERKA